MLRVVILKIEEIYIPAERRKEIDPEKVEAVAEKIMEDENEHPPIQVRRGKDRYVLVKGVHRLEARKALGDDTIPAFIVDARLH